MPLPLRLSLAANLALTGVLALLLWRDHSAVTPRITPPPSSAAASHHQPATSAIASIRPPPPPSAAGTLNRDAVALLERSGVAREVLVNVLVEDLNRRSARRVLALQRRYAPRPVPDREMRALARESDAEQVRALKAAFGEEGYRAWDQRETLRNLNRARPPGDELPMTPGEAERAYQLQKDFDDKNRELQAMMEDGVADRADVGRLQAQAQQALDRQLAQLLGPQRFNELRGQADPAVEVYRTYGDLNPTADQAAAVLQSEQDYRAREAALARGINEDPAAADRLADDLKALRDAHDDRLRQVFGADAYETVKRQNDPAYQTLTQYAGAWELQAPEISSVYASVHALQDQADRLRTAAELREAAGQRVNWREIDATIAQARQQTEIRLAALLGPERLQRLEANGMLGTR